MLSEQVLERWVHEAPLRQRPADTAGPSSIGESRLQLVNNHHLLGFTTLRQIDAKSRMKLSTFAFALLLAISPIHAAWTAIELGEDNEHVVYFDRTCIRAEGARVQVRVLFDNKKPVELDGKQVASSKMLFEYDRLDQKSRYIKMVLYSAAMGQGKVQVPTTDAVATFNPIEVRSLNERVFKIVCALPVPAPPLTQG